jgi:hypothetical protein
LRAAGRLESASSLGTIERYRWQKFILCDDKAGIITPSGITCFRKKSIDGRVTGYNIGGSISFNWRATLAEIWRVMLVTVRTVQTGPFSISCLQCQIVSTPHFPPAEVTDMFDLVASVDTSSLLVLGCRLCILRAAVAGKWSIQALALLAVVLRPSLNNCPQARRARRATALGQLASLWLCRQLPLRSPTIGFVGRPQWLFLAGWAVRPRACRESRMPASASGPLRVVRDRTNTMVMI